MILTGLPAYANEEWVGALLGRGSVGIDDETGEIKVFVYRDDSGACTGSAVVGMVSVAEV